MDKIIHVETVILGAGLSGISAGINLLKNNYDKFNIYESLEVRNKYLKLLFL